MNHLVKTLVAIFALLPALSRAQAPAKPKPAEPVKLEAVHGSMLRIEAVLKKERSSPTHRNYSVEVRNAGGMIEMMSVEIYSFKGDTITKTMTVSKSSLHPRSSAIYGAEVGVAPENGWVVVVRRMTGELIGVKGSARQFEILARTPDALSGAIAPAN